MNKMKHTIAIIGILFLIGLWILPTFMLWHGFNHAFSMIYVIDVIFTALWGSVMDRWYGPTEE